MAKFLAVTSKGLVPALENELKQYSYKNIHPSPHGVFFESNWRGLYKANIVLRNATRILLPLISFDAFTEEELYSKSQKHDFTKHIEPRQTLAIDAQVNSKTFKDRRYVALKIKDAIVDQFRDKFSIRPSVDKENPDLKILVRVHNNQVDISVDTSRRSLSQRGYRVMSTEAPLREHLGSGILDLMGWQPDRPLVDPMCGSGTFLIEAALKAKNIFPLLEARFGFQDLKNFQAEEFAEVKKELAQLQQSPPTQLIGFDKSFKAIENAKANAEAAGVAKDINFKPMRLEEITSKHLPDQPGIVVINPPYGERLEDVKSLEVLFEKMGQVFKEHFSGWSIYLLSGNPELSQFLRLKAEKKIPIFNGPIECRLLHYDIR